MDLSEKGTAEGGVLMLVKDELLDKVVARIRADAGGWAPQVEEFARQYYGCGHGRPRRPFPIDAYGAAVSQWNFAARRQPGERKVRIYNPVFEEHGWQSTHTVVEMVNDDMPFLVDSTRMEINRQGYAIHMILHPLMKVRRDAEGRLVECSRRGRGRRHLRVHYPRRGGPPDEPAVLEDLKHPSRRPSQT